MAAGLCVHVLPLWQFRKEMLLEHWPSPPLQPSGLGTARKLTLLDPLLATQCFLAGDSFLPGKQFLVERFAQCLLDPLLPDQARRL